MRKDELMNKRIRKKRKLEKEVAELRRIANYQNTDISDIELIQIRNTMAINNEFSNLRKALIDQQELTHYLTEAVNELQEEMVNLMEKKPFWKFWK